MNMATPDALRYTRIPLSHGSGAIPAVGFGTLIPDPLATKQATKTALEVGFRHFDCAERYRNEEAVGDAMQAAFRAGTIRREDVFVTTKLGPGGHWRNWVGNQSFIARHIAEPGSEAELAALAREASRQNLAIRVAGSGHSFTPIVATSGLLLSLTNMQGPVSADLDRKRVVVRAGTRIGDIGRALKKIGLSLANQGDIDTQAIAGALSTGTHGTGNRSWLPVVPGGWHAVGSAGRVGL